MDSAISPAPEDAVIRRPVAPPGPSLLPPEAPAGPEPRSVVTQPRNKTRQSADPRVSEVRGAINRCNPLVPYSRSTITVKADHSGKTLILFGEHEARGQLGLCVAKIAAKTKIARGEQFSFKL